MILSLVHMLIGRGRAGLFLAQRVDLLHQQIELAPARFVGSQRARI